jgi:phage baseplate assembly protein W
MADKKLSISKLDKLLKAKQNESVKLIKYEIGEESIEIPVKTYIKFTDMLAMVDGIVSTVFPADDSGETRYVPAVYEYAKALHYIEYFCPTLKIDIGADRAFAMLYGSQIMRDIYKAINPAQYNAIEDAIESAIAYKLSVLTTGERSKIEKATAQIEAAGQALEALTEQFSGIGEDKMQAAIENIATFTPEKMANAVVNINEFRREN